tara:strand:+ start:5478 stop:6179 length:702 start_codon:yes stop_codon:yes gene_type:complete
MEEFKNKILKNVKLSWRKILVMLLKKHKILEKLYELYNSKVIYPNEEDIFKVFSYFDLKEINLVFLGQDPYINDEKHSNKIIPQAEGLAFSVPKTHKIPPSLRNIFKELKNEYEDFNIPLNGNLIRWVKEEKILLLNTALTVEKGKSNSHQSIWVDFVNDLIEYISDNGENVVFLLLGNNAKSKSKLIEEDKHVIVKGIHPSPLSANRGFFNSGIFKKVNEELLKLDKMAIKW